MESTTHTIQKNNLATASLVLGIVGVLFIPFIGILGAGSAVAAVICGIISLNQQKRTGQTGRGMAIAGIVLGFLAFVWAFVLFTVLGPLVQQTFLTIQDALP
jgi:Na+/H+-dicarboxylate symporter